MILFCNNFVLPQDEKSQEEETETSLEPQVIINGTMSLAPNGPSSTNGVSKSNGHQVRSSSNQPNSSELHFNFVIIHFN